MPDGGWIEGAGRMLRRRWLKPRPEPRDPNRPWNLNIEDDAHLDAAIPADARRVLEVGCGDGFLAARLAARVDEVVALDLDAPVLERARARFPDARVDWRLGDLMTWQPDGRPFDAVVSNATLHHLPDIGAALRRMAGFLRPGGVLAIATFVRFEVRELPWQLSALAARRRAIRRNGWWNHSAPIAWPPREGLHRLRAIAADALPGSRVTRTPYGRAHLHWTAPGS